MYMLGSRAQATVIVKVEVEYMPYTVQQRILINLTQLLCQVWFGWLKGEQTYADESTSAFVFRTQKLRWMNWINWIFSDPNHCREAYASELNGTQNAPEYRA